MYREIIMLEQLVYIKERRNGTHIYMCPQKTCIVKCWENTQILQEKEEYEYALQHWISVPTILEYWTLNKNNSYIKECFISCESYATTFCREYEEWWEVSEKQFALFLEDAWKHCRLQMLTQGTSDNIWCEWVYRHGMIDKLTQEWILDEKHCIWIRSFFQKYSEEIPYVWTHWDYNAYNMFPGQCIDLEDRHIGLHGYDFVTAITQNYWFPRCWGEINQEFVFSKNQFTHAESYFTNSNLWYTIKEEYFIVLFLLRWIFVTIWSERFPKLQRFRYNKLFNIIIMIRENTKRHLIKEYVRDNFSTALDLQT
jgi:hypothetical protein